MNKPCHYLRHIDLIAVYEQLPDYDPWGADRPLANIQPQFSDTLARRFNDIADTVFDDLYGQTWEETQPIDVAIEVGEVIEEQLDELEINFSIETGSINHDPLDDENLGDNFLPNLNESKREALDKFKSMPMTKTYDSADYWQLNSLLIYQYDYLCFLYKEEAFSEAFEMCEFIAETRCRIQNIISISFDNKYGSIAASRRAKKAAEQRHAPVNKTKTELLAEWDKTSDKYKSRADFASIIGKREGIKERTLYEWIAKHEKSK